MSKLSIIIPTHNDESIIQDTLESLARLVNIDEVVIVDGSSVDSTPEIIEKFNDKLGKIVFLKTSKESRAFQFHTGAEHATGDILWFLYPEMRPKQGSARKIKDIMKYQEVVGGSFEMIYEANKPITKILVKIQERTSQDTFLFLENSVFVRREIYQEIGGFDLLAVFEIKQLQHKIKKQGSFIVLKGFPVVTSLEKLEKDLSLLKLLKLTVCQLLCWICLPISLCAKLFFTDAD
jgi:cellulose synthase/poly-beta-1,6-N-acetylglucosamine synthase-like glycosyltransferase